jgi:hypothetical protein
LAIEVAGRRAGPCVPRRFPSRGGACQKRCGSVFCPCLTGQDPWRSPPGRYSKDGMACVGGKRPFTTLAAGFGSHGVNAQLDPTAATGPPMHSLPVSSFLNERAGRMWLRLLLVILESRSANRDTIVRQNKFCGQAVVRDRPEAPSRSIPTARDITADPVPSRPDPPRRLRVSPLSLNRCPLGCPRLQVGRSPTHRIETPKTGKRPSYGCGWDSDCHVSDVMSSPRQQ